MAEPSLCALRPSPLLALEPALGLAPEFEPAAELRRWLECDLDMAGLELSLREGEREDTKGIRAALHSAEHGADGVGRYLSNPERERGLEPVSPCEREREPPRELA